LLLLAAVAIWIAITALPFEFEMRRADLLWTLFYGANWHFIASGQDYFAQFASASPLRHAWSLAIEEQFYILWPLIVLTALVTLPRGFRFLAAICIGGALASTVAMAMLYDPGDPSRAYYGTDARIHQLFTGALLAVGLRKRPQQSGGIAATIVGIAASALLLTAFVFLSDRNPGYYRGLSAALALVTAGLIWSVETAPSNVVAKGLSWTPARWIGQLSYGLYLWHWPVILAVTSAPWFSRRFAGQLRNEPHPRDPDGRHHRDLVHLSRASDTAGTDAGDWRVDTSFRHGSDPQHRRPARRHSVGDAAARDGAR
jgi:peptidoglycan/LPS O-acetylase OafA/YrhL